MTAKQMSGEGSRFRLGGLIAAPFTPMRADQINLPVIEQQANALVRGGVKGAFICGSTGEGVSLSTAERSAVAEEWMRVAGEKLKVIVHVGHTSLAEACELARHAAKIKAAAIGAMPPFYYKPANVEQLVDFCAVVASAGGDTPFYYYHIPTMTGVQLSMARFLEVASEKIPSLYGIKFTNSDMSEYQRCLHVAGGRFEIAWGVDEMLLGALAIGAQSAVGSTYNYSAPLYLKMIDAFCARDMSTAREYSRKTVELIAVLLKYGGVRTGKAIMSMIGIACGPPRLPLTPLNDAEVADVRAQYERLGFFNDTNVAAGR